MASSDRSVSLPGEKIFGDFYPESRARSSRVSPCIFVALLLTASWGIALPAASQTPPEQIAYGVPLKFEGRIIKKDFPGPPEFESIAKGDARVPVWILELSIPITVPGKKEDSPDMEGAKGVKRIQLKFSDPTGKFSADYEYLKKHYRKGSFEVQGALHHAIGPMDVLPVSLWVTGISPVKAGSSQ